MSGTLMPTNTEGFQSFLNRARFIYLFFACPGQRRVTDPGK